MSDGITDAFRVRDHEKPYLNKVQFIKTAPLEDVCRLYKIGRTSAVFVIFNNHPEVSLKKDFDYYSNDYQYRLTLRIPGAMTWTEDFLGKTLEEVCTRCEVYLKWAETDLGQKAIEKYLNH